MGRRMGIEGDGKPTVLLNPRLFTPLPSCGSAGAEHSEDGEESEEEAHDGGIRIRDRCAFLMLWKLLGSGSRNVEFGIFERRVNGRCEYIEDFAVWLQALL